MQRTVTLPYSLRGGGGGRALCTFLSRAFPHFNRPGPIASRREQREGGREAHPGRTRKPLGRQSPAAPADSSAAADRAPGSAAVFLLSSSTFSSSSSSSPSLKGESSVRRREKNLGRCVGCPAIGSVLAIKMKSKKGSCDGVPGQSGVPRAPTRGGRGKGGLSLSQPESLCLLGRFVPRVSPLPPHTPWPVSRGRLQWMLCSQTKHAGLLFGGGRLSAPLAPCQKHVQPFASCPPPTFVLAPSVEPLPPALP